MLTARLLTPNMVNTELAIGIFNGENIQEARSIKPYYFRHIKKVTGIKSNVFEQVVRTLEKIIYCGQFVQ